MHMRLAAGKIELTWNLLGTVYSEKAQKKGPQLGEKPSQNMISTFVFLLLTNSCTHGASMGKLPQSLFGMLVPFRIRLLEVKYPLELLAAQWPGFDLM